MNEERDTLPGLKRPLRRERGTDRDRALNDARKGVSADVVEDTDACIVRSRCEACEELAHRPLFTTASAKKKKGARPRPWWMETRLWGDEYVLRIAACSRGVTPCAYATNKPSLLVVGGYAKCLIGVTPQGRSLRSLRPK